jgi:predicted short-subunit dehydrogenase-like oxidoreductase (DUF2520 family)
MLVTLIGSGNLATVLGRQFVQNGHRATEVWSRDPAHAGTLAAELNATPVEDLASLDPNSDLFVLAIADDALPAVAARLSLGSKLVIHTAGSVSKDVLQHTSTNYGVLWPMKMIRTTMDTLGPVTIIVDGSSPAVAAQIEKLAREFTGTVARADDALRIKLHMLAAVTANFTNHLYRLAADYCEQEGIDFSLLYPIITDTALRIWSAHPASVQAGPASRGDLQTLEKHQELLKEYPKLAALYAAISSSIMK